MSNGSQAYHNTDSYSYNALTNSSNPSTNQKCDWNRYFLRSYYDYGVASLMYCGLVEGGITGGAVLAFSF